MTPPHILTRFENAVVLGVRAGWSNLKIAKHNHSTYGAVTAAIISLRERGYKLPDRRLQKYSEEKIRAAEALRAKVRKRVWEKPLETKKAIRFMAEAVWSRGGKLAVVADTQAQADEHFDAMLEVVSRGRKGRPRITRKVFRYG